MFLLTRFMLLEHLSLSLSTTPLLLSPAQQLIASLALSLSPFLEILLVEWNSLPIHQTVPLQRFSKTFFMLPFLKTFFIGPYILNIINSSLNTCIVPTRFKHAIVQPLIKKTNLEASVLSNFRSISELPSLSKVLEKVVVTQLQAFLDTNSIFRYSNQASKLLTVQQQHR